MNTSTYTLKRRERYFGYVLESLLRVVFDSIHQVILSAQKAAVRYLSRIYVYPKRNKLRLQNRTLVLLLNFSVCHSQTSGLFKSEGFREYKIWGRVGSMHGILHMRTSHKFFVAGETRKYFSTLLDELDNKSAPNFKNIKKEKLNLDWLKNDKKLFERAVSVNALKRA